jgi:hypothetical protein
VDGVPDATTVVPGAAVVQQDPRIKVWRARGFQRIVNATVVSREAGEMTLFFRVTIENVVHEVRVDVPGAKPGDQAWPEIEEFALRTAWLEHHGRLPTGVTNALA